MASDITILTKKSITGFDFDNNNISGTGIVSGSISFVGSNSAGGMHKLKEHFHLQSPKKTHYQTPQQYLKLKVVQMVFAGAQGGAGNDGTDGVSGRHFYQTTPYITIKFIKLYNIICRCK